MGKQKFDRVKLSRMLREGKSQKDIAKAMNVSEAAICKAKKELNINVVKNVALENAHKVVDKNLDAVQQLQTINEKANQMLDEVTGEDKIIDRIVKAVEGALTYEGDPKKQTAYIRRIAKQVSQDRFLALKSMNEIRGQLSLQLDIFKTLYDLQAIQEFQAEVLSAIGEVETNVRDRIIQRLKETKALRSALQIN